MLVHRPVEVGPPAGDPDVSLVGEPPLAGNMPAEPGGLDELGREPLDPPVDGDVINGDATLSQQLLDVPLGQAVAQVPADRDRNHLRWKPEASEHRGRRHGTSLP
jgi:hypothetical protein